MNLNKYSDKENVWNMMTRMADYGNENALSGIQNVFAYFGCQFTVFAWYVEYRDVPTINMHNLGEDNVSAASRGDFSTIPLHLSCWVQFWKQP